MAESTQVTYTCSVCGYVNTWTRHEILRRGTRAIFRDLDSNEDVYSLPCKNPRLSCTGRRNIAVTRQERD